MPESFPVVLMLIQCIIDFLWEESFPLSNLHLLPLGMRIPSFLSACSDRLLFFSLWNMFLLQVYFLVVQLLFLYSFLYCAFPAGLILRDIFLFLRRFVWRCFYRFLFVYLFLRWRSDRNRGVCICSPNDTERFSFFVMARKHVSKWLLCILLSC